MNKDNKTAEKPYPGPYLHTPQTTRAIMIDVLFALTPAMLGAVYYFGFRAAVLLLISIGVSMLTEYIFQRVSGRPVSIGDGSAAVTGALLAMNLPVTTPVWVLAAGDVFAILVVKQFFGGIGDNFMNPALAGRAFLMAVWQGKIINYVMPFDSVSTSTVLTAYKAGNSLSGVQEMDLFLGKAPGALGETSKLLLLIGFLYLCRKKIVSVKTTAAYILTVVILTFLFSPRGFMRGDVIIQLFGGGLLLGAFFMITDYSFASAGGRLVLAVIAGSITAWIRIAGAYPEGVCYGILIGNCLTGIAERFARPRVFGKNRLEKRE